MFQGQDSYQYLYSRQFLKKYRKMEHGEDNDLKIYYAIFKNVLDNLKIRELILKVKCTELFLKELLMQARERAIRKINMNSKKLKIMKFDTVCAFIIKEA